MSCIQYAHTANFQILSFKLLNCTRVNPRAEILLLRIPLLIDFCTDKQDFLSSKLLPHFVASFIFTTSRWMASTDVFLTHDWGTDELGRKNHDRVANFNEELKMQGFSTWFDSDRMEGDVMHQMANGIDNASVVLVFVTRRYMEKVNKVDEDDNCQKEFSYAVQRKGTSKMIAIVMEPSMRKTSAWSGKVGLNLGSKLWYDFSDDDKLDDCVLAVAKEIENIQVRGAGAFSDPSSSTVVEDLVLVQTQTGGTAHAPASASMKSASTPSAAAASTTTTTASAKLSNVVTAQPRRVEVSAAAKQLREAIDAKERKEKDERQWDKENFERMKEEHMAIITDTIASTRQFTMTYADLRKRVSDATAGDSYARAGLSALSDVAQTSRQGAPLVVVQAPERSVTHVGLCCLSSAGEYTSKECVCERKLSHPSLASRCNEEEIVNCSFYTLFIVDIISCCCGRPGWGCAYHPPWKVAQTSLKEEIDFKGDQELQEMCKHLDYQ